MRSVFRNKLFRVLFIIMKILVILFIVTYLGFILVQKLSDDKSIMGYRLFTMTTGSMIGVYDVDDVIAVKNCDTTKLKVGDDIAYWGNYGGMEGKLIIHRIIKIEDDKNSGKKFVTKGVNSKIEDPAIVEEQILGKVVGIVPIVTTVNHIVKTQVGFFLLIFLPLFLMIVLELFQTIMDIKLEKGHLGEVSSVINVSGNSNDEKKTVF